MSGGLRNNCVNHFCFVAKSEHYSVATNPLALWMLFEMIHYSVECTGKIDVVAVDKRKDVAGDFLEAFVDRMNLATILFAHPISQSIFVATNNRSTLVRATAVNDDVFKILKALIQDAENGLFQKSPLVKRRCHYAEF